MQITPVIGKTSKVIINKSHPKNNSHILLFNEVDNIIKKRHVPATLHTGEGRIELPSATIQVLDDLKKLGIHYEPIVK
jgi:hypothetical protein